MKMNNLNIIAKVFITLFVLNIAAISWAQTSLSGNGKEDDPYIIGNINDWNNVFTNETYASTYWEYGIWVRLDCDLNVSTMVGTSSNYYRGTFDGNGHTIIFNKGTAQSPYDEEKCALFRFINGASIKDLKVEGTIISSKKFASGLIGWANNTRPVYITNCIVNVTINCTYIEKGTVSSKYYDCSSGGIIGQIESGSVYFENCIFKGNIIDLNPVKRANRCAGFVSYINNGSIKYTNCTMAGVIDVKNNYSTFNRNNKNQYVKSYYSHYHGYGDVPATGCQEASYETNGFSIKYMDADTAKYVGGAVITGMEETVFHYTGDDIEIIPSISYYGWTLTRGTDYVIKVDGEILESGNPTFNAAGNYIITLEGINNYAGSSDTEIRIIELNSWSALIEALATSEGTFTLTSDITAQNPRTTDTACVVTGNITLNMNGHTINRNLTDSIAKGQVIRVLSGGSLTLNGGDSGGTITGGFNWAQGSNIDGGGIYNKGTLILNNVDVINNKCVKATYNPESAEARGGGIYSGPKSTLIINGGYIEYNEARGGGGGVYGDNATTFTMDGVYVYGNQSESKGGGIRVKTADGDTATFKDCYIWMNMATIKAGDGGGIYMESGELHMDGCQIMGNQSKYRGCGIYVHNAAKVIATNCLIDYNGSYTPDFMNLGGGICLYDSNSASQVKHTTFIMDGGSIIGNNSIADGGGVYVYAGAIFQVKGDIQIYDNFRASIETGGTDNNVYLIGSSVVEVIGELGDNAIINITPNGSSSTYVEFAEGFEPTPETLAHFSFDGEDYNMMIDDKGDVVVYESYKWDDVDTWDGTAATDLSGNLPTQSDNIEISRVIKIPKGYRAYAYDITFDGEYGKIVVEEGGELIAHNAVKVSMEKDVVAAQVSYESGWYLISSAVNNPSIAESTNLIAESYFGNEYDLYRFNENAENQWENYRADHSGDADDFTKLTNGRGYLYRGSSARTITIDGNLNVGNIVIRLTYNTSSALTPGLNIIGNPYSFNIKKGNTHAIPNTYLEDNYYVLDKDNGTWVATDDGTEIPPLTGILVQAKTKPDNLTIYPIPAEIASKSGRGDISEVDKIWFAVSNSEFKDAACVMFNRSGGLNKISHRNPNAPMLYITSNGERFASVGMNEDIREFELSFEAKTMGRYTLSAQTAGEYRYLHIIDRLTGDDVDLLAEGGFSFMAAPSDRADRFTVRLAYKPAGEGDSDNEPFAYQSGRDVVVEGEGELQVFDVTGRYVMGVHINGIETVEIPSQGVYIMRMTGDGVKTQKIIVK